MLEISIKDEDNIMIQVVSGTNIDMLADMIVELIGK